MRRCFTDPHYWKNPALRRSREKGLDRFQLVGYSSAKSASTGICFLMFLIVGNYACRRYCLSTCFNTSCEPFRRQMWMRFQAVPASTSRARTVAPLTWWCGRDLKGTAKAQKPWLELEKVPISGGLKLNSVKRWLGGSWQVFRF